MSWWRTPSTWYAQQNPKGARVRARGLRRDYSVRYIRHRDEVLPRLRRRLRPPARRPGATIVMVSFNSVSYLPGTIAMVRKHTDPSVRLLVVDNCSTDGTAEWLAANSVEAVLLRENIDHGRAMNVGWTRSATEFTLSLDIDAFPIRPDWLDLVLPPLRSGYRVAGAFQDRAFVHPCWLAMETERFFRRGHTFEDGHNWDTGELISWREYPELHLIPLTSLRGPAWLGQVYGDAVYHNGYSTASFRIARGEALDGKGPVVTKTAPAGDEPLRAWREALRRYGCEA